MGELDRTGAELGAGEGVDGAAGCAAELEDAAADGGHAVGEAAAVRVADAEVGGGQGDGLSFLHSEAGATEQRRIVDGGDRWVNAHGGAVDAAVVGGEGEGGQIGAGIHQGQASSGEQHLADISAGAEDVVGGVAEYDGDGVAVEIASGEAGDNGAHRIGRGVLGEGRGAEQREAGGAVLHHVRDGDGNRLGSGGE